MPFYDSLNSIGSIRKFSSSVIANFEPKTAAEPQKISESAKLDIKIYKRRFWMLFLFCTLSLLCSMMYPLYTGIASVTECYYNVSQEAVNWTSLLMSVVYIIFFPPVSIFINKMGLRKSVLCISFLNTVASACQFATLKPNGFTYAILSMFFAYLSSVFIYALPPFIAAVWFPSNEVSRACAFGVSGNQLGSVCGFLLTPFMVSSDCSRKDLIENGKFNIACILTAANIGMLVLTALTFQNEPLNPPSECQVLKEKSTSIPYKTSVLRIIRNKHFILLLFMYGLFVATFITFATMLNETVIHYFPGRQKDVGIMGAILIGTGMIGSIVAGYILDLTHKFKETSMGICIAALLSLMCFSGLLLVNNIWILFITIGVFGFFLMSYISVGFEFGIELTYPDLEIISASLLTLSTMVFGIALTEISSFVMTNVSVLASNGVLCINLFFCCILSSLMTTEYKRSKKNVGETVAVPLKSFSLYSLETPKNTEEIIF